MELYGIKLERWEIDAIVTLDLEYRSAVNEINKKEDT